MKNRILTYLIPVFFFTLSCTDVIDVDVPAEEPRLVIEASMDFEKGTYGREQTIKLSLSTPYFENLNETPVTGASVKVTNNFDGIDFIFTDQNDGTYHTDEFEPELSQSYSIEDIYDNEVYVATETMTPVTDIINVYQSTENGFDQNALEVNIDFIDPEGIPNYYLSKFQRRGDPFQTLFDLKDEFTDGNIMSIFYEKRENEDTGNKEFEPRDVIAIPIFGVSEQYYNYIKLLIEQSEPGGPFSTIPAEIKGNCINLNNPDNYAYGYFRVSEVDKRVYTFE